MRQLTKDEVKFSVDVESEDLQVRGNYMCTEDSEADKAAEDEILNRLDRGDIYAWCVIKVTAEWEGFKGIATLGGVSFSENDNGQKEAEAEAEMHGLFEEALEDLNNNLKAYVKNAENISGK